LPKRSRTHGRARPGSSGSPPLLRSPWPVDASPTEEEISVTSLVASVVGLSSPEVEMSPVLVP
jgi:hypothetical protein